jgi:hypothetical protein
LISIIIIISFVLALRQLFIKLNGGFPIFELTIMLYILQYLIATLFEYAYNDNPYQTMAIPANEYFEFTLLAVLALTLGLFSIKSKFKFDTIKIESDLASLVGRSLLVIGFASQVALEFLPDAFKSTVNFFILFKTVGIYSLVFSNNRIDKGLIIMFSIQIAAGAILNALLIEFIVFSLFLAMFYSMKYKITNKLKYSFFILGFVFLSVYQGVKKEYRNVVWEKELSTNEKIALLGSLINFESFGNAFDTNFKDNESLIQTMHRLNQGWQTSKVYHHVPEKVEFENGKEFINDILSSFMPRFLWENKRVVNDYRRFNYYTGHHLTESTAMSMGVIGDFYINFGRYGTIAAMFLFGHFMARIKRYFIQSFVIMNPINLIWLPFIFNYLVRPGNEFYMVINHMFKATIVLFVVFKVIYPFIKVKENQEEEEVELNLNE